tara:strand:- start:1486 stop:2811 length:1326 start_codon:yes stop_codon:yes gene_type:complete
MRIFIQNFISKLNIKTYLFIVILIETFSIFISYKYLFDYQGCTKNIIREFNFFNNTFNFLYPEMCDEPFYFHGFQWINHIYEPGFIYQDRPLYLVIGFLIYRFLFVISLIFNFYIEPISLLLLTSLIIQILIVNIIAYLICKLLIGKFQRFYFLIFLILTLFSFEHRIYFFLPSNSTTYYLIFIFSIFSIKNDKFNGLFYGFLFTISAYGVIGFLYEIIRKTFKFKKNIRQITINVLLFSLPTLAFEVFRLLIGVVKGSQYAIRYVHAAEAENQQFVWFLKNLFSNSYEPAQACHTISNFIPCYVAITKNFFSINVFYSFLCFVLLTAYLLKFKNFDKKVLFPIMLFSLFNYLFISFQGVYNYRFVYYSLGFLIILLISFFILKINNDFVTLSFLLLMSIYTLSRTTYEQYNTNLNGIELFIFVCSLIILLSDLIKSRRTA